MSRLKDALPRVLLVTFISLLLQQGGALAYFRLSPSYSDTVYLDRNGSLLRKVPNPRNTVTFIVRTTKKTEELYGSRQQDKENVERGMSNPISSEEAEKTEVLIRNGKFEKALQTGNLVKLTPLAERRQDGKLMLKDNGQGGEQSPNNREYATIVYKDENRVELMGTISDPHTGGESIDVPHWTTVVRYCHSHASGIRQIGDTTWQFSPQAPSRSDILALSGEQTSIVFGRDTDLVYIYDFSGVIAVMPTKAYLKF